MWIATNNCSFSFWKLRLEEIIRGQTKKNLWNFPVSSQSTLGPVRDQNFVFSTFITWTMRSGDHLRDGSFEYEANWWHELFCGEGGITSDEKNIAGANSINRCCSHVRAITSRVNSKGLSERSSLPSDHSLSFFFSFYHWIAGDWFYEMRQHFFSQT